MIYKFVDHKIDYDGSQLSSLFAYMNLKLMGDSIVAFLGGCNIPFENMVDGEDQLAKSEIRSAQMLHFIIEEFGKNLELAVAHQRLFAVIVHELLAKQLPHLKFYRTGDDIYLDDAKFSISIATVSPVSALIHFAVNVSNIDTPVKTICLRDLGLKEKEFADGVAGAFLEELQSMKQACTKVHWVK